MDSPQNKNLFLRERKARKWIVTIRNFRQITHIVFWNVNILMKAREHCLFQTDRKKKKKELFWNVFKYKNWLEQNYLSYEKKTS